MDGAVNATSTKEGAVGSVDDGVQAQLGYVVADQADFGRVRWSSGRGRWGCGGEATEFVEQGKSRDGGEVQQACG